jgi:hypothetical protein
MTDEELIAAGRKHAAVIQRAQLELGRLALQYAPIGDASVKTGAYTRLREYADAIGVDEGTLRNYRAVAHAWQEIPAPCVGFTTMKALTSVAHKDRLVELLEKTPPPTKSGRWTVPAAVELAKDAGLWSHDGASRTADVVAFLRRTRGTLARVDVAELGEQERQDLVAVVNEVSSELLTLRERLLGMRVG